MQICRHADMYTRRHARRQARRQARFPSSRLRRCSQEGPAYRLCDASARKIKSGGRGRARHAARGAAWPPRAGSRRTHSASASDLGAGGSASQIGERLDGVFRRQQAFAERRCARLPVQVQEAWSGCKLEHGC